MQPATLNYDWCVQPLDEVILVLMRYNEDMMTGRHIWIKVLTLL